MTAVECLESQLTDYLKRIYKQEIEEAKEMFEKQIIDAYQKGYRNGGDNFGYGNKTTPIEYYKETFNK